jgi:hypothetical protein
MESPRFDDLAKAVGRTASRRTTARAALGSLLALAGMAEAKAIKKGKRVRTERCLYVGEKCPKTLKHGRKKKRHTCEKSCCTRYSELSPGGKRRCACLSEGQGCTEATARHCCSQRCSDGLCGSAAPTGPVILPPRCNFPLRRDLAPQGSGTAGTNQCAVADGCQQTVQISLQGAPANTGYDVYIDQESAGNLAHKFAGTFTTDAAGNAFFQNTIIVPGACPSVVDNELVRQGATYPELGDHQFIQESFTPCPFC